MYIYEKRAFKKTGLYIVFDAGSLYEAEGQKGCHHLMEHLICQTFKDQMDTLQRFNISWNAYTCNDSIVFHFTGMEKYFSHDLKRTLIERITGGLTPYVTEESFKNEQQTVYQEYLDSFTDPESAHYLNIMRQHFGTYSTIGNETDILNFTLADANKLFKKLFKPSKIIEIGPTKTEGVKVKFKDAKTSLPTIKMKWKNNYKLPLYSVSENDKTDVFMVCKKTISKADFPYMLIASAMLTAGLNSPLYEEIRVKRGLSYYSRRIIETNISCATLIFSASTDNAKAEELKKVYIDVFSNIKKHLKKSRFNDVMENIVIDREEAKLLRYANVDDIIDKGKVGLPKNLKKITFEKVIETVEKYIPYFEVIAMR